MLQRQPIFHDGRNEFVFETTSSNYCGEIDSATLHELLLRLSECPSLLGSRRGCVLYGYGSRPRSAYRELAQDANLHVHWHSDIFPWPLKPLGLLVAAHSGLVEVNEPCSLLPAAKNLATLALVELYSFAEGVLSEVKHHVKHRKRKSRIGTVIGRDETYYCLGIDGDSPSSNSGLSAWVTWGSKCPTDLIEATRPAIREFDE